jgi:CBS domain-containing protein
MNAATPDLAPDQAPVNDPLAAPLGILLRRAPVTCNQSTPIRTALELMRKEQVGSILVTDRNHNPVGLFTLRDLRDRVVLGTCNIDEPIAGVMSPNVVKLDVNAPALEAAMAMARHSIRHVVLTDHGKAAGVISERDLFALQQQGVSRIARCLREAASLDDLRRTAQDIRTLARTLQAQGVGPEQLTRLISELNDQLAENLIKQHLAAADLGGIRWCWLALGSEGRLEQTLCTDQDNGLIFAPPAGMSDEDARARLLPLALQVNEGLAACGFPLCNGGIMASNPKWCLAEGEWRDTFADWLFRGDAPVLLHATIFFDFRALAGDAGLAAELRAWLSERIKAGRHFLKAMTVNALANRAPLGLVRDFVLSEDEAYRHTVDLKINGVTLFVDAARIFALAAGLSETGTAARLRGAVEAWRLDQSELAAWLDGFHTLQSLRLGLHQDQQLHGQAMHNHLNPDELSAHDRRRLKEALKAAKRLQGKLESFFQF